MNDKQSSSDPLDTVLIIGFLYGIESDRLKPDEIKHRVAGFKHTKGFKEAKQAIEKLLVKVREDELEWVSSQLVAIPCEEDCTPIRHAQHQGSWDMCREIERDIENRISAFNKQLEG